MFSNLKKLFRSERTSKRSFMRIAPIESTFGDVYLGTSIPHPIQLIEAFSKGLIDPAIYYEFQEDNDDTGFTHRIQFFGVTAENQQRLYSLYDRQLASLKSALVIGEDDFLNPILIGLNDDKWSVYRLDLEIDDTFEIASDVTSFFDKLVTPTGAGSENQQ